MQAEKLSDGLAIWLEPQEVVSLAVKRHVLSGETPLKNSEAEHMLIAISVSRDKTQLRHRANVHGESVAVMLSELVLPAIVSVRDIQNRENLGLAGDIVIDVATV